MYLTFETD